jgi:hypothetical protein
MEYIGCTIKQVPPHKLLESATTAVGINPANAPNTTTLGPEFAPSRDRLAVMTQKFWGAAGVRLTVGFLDNPPADLKRRILAHMNAWGAWSNVQFSETNTSPQVRIARTAGDGYWSYLGTDVLSIAANEATMNLDSFTMNTAESEFHRVIRHETGHTLGFPHEHRRKEIVDRIDREKAISLFMSTQGWTRDEVIEQVLTPFDNSALTATAATDQNSIMCYALPAQIMKDGIAVPGGTDIDNLDAQFSSTLYPGPVAPSAVWPNGKVYLFKGKQYLRYDVASDKTDPGYPVAIAGNWNGFPANFTDGVDAGVVWTTGKAYFFKDSQYVRFDLPSDQVDPGYPAAISANWHGLWSENIDAALVWPNGKAYFFKGSEYMRFDIAHDTVDPGYPAPIAGNWPGMPAEFASGIDEAVVWNNGKAYFFKDSQYVRYDIAADRVDPGYPQPIAGNWPGVWADGVGR